MTVSSFCLFPSLDRNELSNYMYNTVIYKQMYILVYAYILVDELCQTNLRVCHAKSGPGKKWPSPIFTCKMWTTVAKSGLGTYIQSGKRTVCKSLLLRMGVIYFLKKKRDKARIIAKS